jgi:uncharacterized protein YoxC
VSSDDWSDDCPLSKYLVVNMNNNPTDQSHNLENSMSDQYNGEIEFHQAVEDNIVDPGNMNSIEGGEMSSLSRPNDIESDVNQSKIVKMTDISSDEFLNKFMDRIGNVILDTTRGMFDELKAEIRGVKDEVKELKNEMKLIDLRVNKRLDDTINKYDVILDENKTKIEDINAKLTSVNSDLQVINQNITNHDEKFVSVESKMNKIEGMVTPGYNVNKHESANINGFLKEQEKWKQTFRLEIESQIRYEVTVLDEKIDSNFKLIKGELIDLRNELCKEIRELRGTPETLVKNNQSEKINRKDDPIGLVKQTSNVAEMYLVEFSGEIEQYVHPMYFLKFAKKFSEISENIWETDKLILLKYLKGPANSWAREVIMSLNSYDDFELAFKRQYWNKTIQRQFENDLLGEGDFVPGKSDLSTYVLKYYEKNSYLDRPFTMSEFINEIARHLPQSIGLSLATARDINSKSDLEMLLRQLSKVVDDKQVIDNKFESKKPAVDTKQNYPKHFENRKGYGYHQGTSHNSFQQQRNSHGGYRDHNENKSENSNRPKFNADQGASNQK